MFLLWVSGVHTVLCSMRIAYTSTVQASNPRLIALDFEFECEERYSRTHMKYILEMCLDHQFRVSCMCMYLFKFVRVCIDMYLIFFRVYLIIVKIN